MTDEALNAIKATSPCCFLNTPSTSKARNRGREEYCSLSCVCSLHSSWIQTRTIKAEDGKYFDRDQNQRRQHHHDGTRWRRERVQTYLSREKKLSIPRSDGGQVTENMLGGEGNRHVVSTPVETRMHVAARLHSVAIRYFWPIVSDFCPREKARGEG